MSKTFFTADYHWGHKNILNLCNRPYETIEEHDQDIVDKNNEVVTSEDTLYHLGDICFKGSPQYMSDLLHQMNFKKMVFLWGNHDKTMKQAIEKGFLDDLINNDRLEIIGNPDLNQRTSLRINIEGQNITLFHYAMRTWDGAFRNSYHLFGHSHSNLPPLYKSMDVGVDTNNFYPWEFSQIKEVMDKVSSDFQEK